MKIILKQSISVLLTFILIAGLLPTGIPIVDNIAPVKAHAVGETLESVAAGSYINFGGQTWRLADPAKRFLVMKSNFGDSPWGTSNANATTIFKYLNDNFNNIITDATHGEWIQETRWNLSSNSNQSSTEDFEVNTPYGQISPSFFNQKLGILSLPEWNNYKVYIGNPNSAMWTRSPILNNSTIWYILAGVSSNQIFSVAYGVRPVLYLIPGLTISGGSGTSDSPYTISKTRQILSLSDLPAGSLVYDKDSTWQYKDGDNYSGNNVGSATPLEWRVAKHNHFGAGMTLLLSDTLVAKYNFSSLNSNLWNGSSLRNWLRGTFYSSLSTNFQNGVQLVSTLNAGATVTNETVFLLSQIEMDGDTQYITTTAGDHGTKTSYYTRGTSVYWMPPRILQGYTPTLTNLKYWTRSPQSGSSTAVRTVDTYGSIYYGGNLNNVAASTQSIGVLPAVNLSSNIQVIVESDGRYRLFADTQPPINTSGWPKADTPTNTGFTIREKTNENGTAYYVVLASGSTAPTAAQVKAGVTTSGAVLKSGSIALTANTEGVAVINTLSSGKPYDVYLVAQDASGNLQTNATKVLVTTVTVDSTPPFNAFGWPKADTPTNTGFTIRAKTNETGTAYYVVVEDGTASPSVQQVKSGLNSASLAALVSGNFMLSANVEGTKVVNTLAPTSAYDLYVVISDTSGNLQTDATQVDVERLTSSDASVGQYVRFGKYNGKPIDWRVIAMENGKPLLFAENILTLKAFDASGDGTDGRSDSNRMAYGSNYWEKSNLREWLNSSNSPVSFSHNSPSTARVEFGNPYIQERGFLSNFTPAERALLAERSHKVLLTNLDKSERVNTETDVPHGNVTSITTAVNNYDTANYKTVTDKVFLLSIKELFDFVYNNSKLGGTQSERHMRIPTASAVTQSTSGGYSDATLNTSSPWYYWLRTPLASNAGSVRNVTPQGYIENKNAYSGNQGVVPAILLQQNLCMSGGLGTVENPYTFGIKSNEIQVGQYVRFGQYNGQPIDWRVINVENGKPLLFAEKILTLKAFDASGDGTDGRSNSGRISYGSNYWEKSNLREWLNSSSNAVTFSHNAPSASLVWGGKNSYDQEAGFLSNFTPGERNALVERNHKVLLSDLDRSKRENILVDQSHIYNTNIDSVVQNYDTSNYQYGNDKVFLLSIKELYDFVYARGFTYTKKPTAEAVRQSAQGGFTDVGLTTGNNWYYRLRTPTTANSYDNRSIYPDGTIGTNNAYHGGRGVVPAVLLKSGMHLSGSGTPEDPYVVVALDKVQNPILSSKGIARWDFVSNATSYDVQLFNGQVSLGSPVNVASYQKSYNFADKIKEQGLGNYKITVVAKQTGDAWMHGPESEDSNIRALTKLANPTYLVWDGYIAKWTAVPFAESYEVKLFKDGVEVVDSTRTLSAANLESGVDYSLIIKATPGSYKFSVRAKGNF